MPIAEIQSPDGSVFEVEYPEGSTDQQILDFVSSNADSFQPEQPSSQPISNEAKARRSARRRTEAIPKEELSKRQGAFFRSVGQGATLGLSDEIMSALEGLGGLGSEKGVYGTFQEAQSRRQSQLEEDVRKYPGITTGGQIIGGVGTGVVGGATKGGAALTNFLSKGSNVARIGKAALAGGVVGGVEGAATARQGERLEGAAKGAAIGAGTAGTLASAGRVIDEVITPNIDDATRVLAKQAKKFGIDLRIDQVAPSKVRNTAQKVSQSILGSGTDEFEDMQRKQFNKAVAKTLSDDIDDLTPESLNKAINKISKEFDTALKGKKIAIPDDVITDIDDQLAFISQNMDPISLKKVNRIYGQMRESLQGNVLNAEKLQSMRSELLKIQARASGDQKGAFGNLIDRIDGALDDGIGDEVSNRLKNARKKYRNYKIVENSMRGSTDGVMNPTQLNRAVESNKFIKDKLIESGNVDIVDLGRIGKKFLPIKGGSDTFEKSTLAGSIGGIGAAGFFGGPVAAVAAAGGATATAGANRAFQKGINQNQKLISKIIDKTTKSFSPKTLGGVSGGVSQAIEGATDVLSAGSRKPIEQEAQGIQEQQEPDLKSRLEGFFEDEDPASDTAPQGDFQSRIKGFFESSNKAQPQGSGDFNDVIEDVFQEEGGFVADDAGAGPTKFGINKKANPDVDVKNLTKDQAKSIYKRRYWDKIKASKLSPDMRVAAMDAAVNQGVSWTNKAIKQSGGDLDRFIELRKKRYINTARNPKKKQFLTAWLDRLDRVNKKSQSLRGNS